MNIVATRMMDGIFDTLPSGMLLFTPGGEILRMNRKAGEILGLSVDAKPQNLKYDLPSYLAPLVSLLTNEIRDVERAEIALSLPTREETSIIGFNLKRVAWDEGPATCVFTFSDITQILRDRLALDKIKEELSQSRKLAAIGTMIAGVAHEMNNPLTGISMSATLLRMNLERLSGSPAVREQPDIARPLESALQEIRKIAGAAEKAGALVGDLLSYAKPDQLFLRPHLLPEVVRDIVAALKTHPQFSRFTIQIENGQLENCQMENTQMENHVSQTVLCDRIRLEQVFYNLIKNACEATDGQGVVTISFSEAPQEDGRMFLVAHVRDNGPGIDTTIINRIFDPFFTTKGHQGVGLGLSLCYRAVEQHGGRLTVESVKPKGTEFRIALPVYLEENTARGYAGEPVCP